MLLADIMALVAPPVTDLLRRSRSVTQDAQPMFPTIVAVRNDRVLATVSTLRIEATMSAAPTMAVGLDPQALVVATEARVDDRPALTYAVMTRERQARWVLQEIHGDGPEVRFSVPVDGGEPRGQAAGTLRVLAEALSQRPMDVSTVARQDRSGTFGEDTFLPPQQGRVVVDAGAMSTLHERVADIGGQVLYLPRSHEAGRLALEAGLPRACLIVPDPPASS